MNALTPIPAKLANDNRSPDLLDDVIRSIWGQPYGHAAKKLQEKAS